ncbi:MAG: SDR family oxidoreductase [Oscillatoriophycideae cyanobacterium NC_groundwater_1537_Pr4_S-0.65um_50_18]|nr:SDR family oxidoreductase [Oscillatoriophycideae cyanobacterium NC_groundwater_1537_Pr4_S-0.65um_50_18]
MQLAEKQVVVVGGSQGIGYETARLAAQAGAKVTIMGRSPEKLQAARDRLGEVQTAVVDITDAAAVHQAFAAMQHVDHVYIAAGSFVGGKILDGAVDHFRAALESRLWGSVHVIQSAASKIPAGGSVTLTGGLSTDRPVAGAWVTAVATAAAEQMSRALAVELSPIRINAVAPGWTDTPMWDAIFGEAKQGAFQEVAAKIPTGRLATAEEVASAVIFLMCNSAITGEVIHTDGGHRYV